jgi:cyclopropane fatty-acyl-phospholipid synthase-like methyltransferase
VTACLHDNFLKGTSRERGKCWLIDQLKKLLPTPLKRLFRLLVPQAREDSDQYVGTTEVSGRLQLELLRREGCRPDSRVLDIGCGNLHAGIQLIRYLEKGNYVGIDPNEWLRADTMKKRSNRQLVKEKQARFLSVNDFDASELDMKFDFILSHSVLSHCAHWQLQTFLQNASKVLAPKGRILASIRLAEGNAHGSEGSPTRDDSRHQVWEYPGVTWFKLSTVTKAADELGLTAVHIPEYTEFYVKSRPIEHHDWLVFHRKL